MEATRFPFSISVFSQNGSVFFVQGDVFFFELRPRKFIFAKCHGRALDVSKQQWYLVGKVSFERFLFEGPDFRIAIQVSLDQRRVAA